MNSSPVNAFAPVNGAGRNYLVLLGGESDIVLSLIEKSIAFLSVNTGIQFQAYGEVSVNTITLDGAAGLLLSVSADITQRVGLAGSTGVTFSTTADVVGLVGLAGTLQLVFGASGDLLVSKFLGGESDLVFDLSKANMRILAELGASVQFLMSAVASLSMNPHDVDVKTMVRPADDREMRRPA